MLPPHQLDRAIERVVREEWGRILSALVTSLGDFQLAEDCLQDAVTRAMTAWARDGLPDAPAAWLITTARRRALDHFRKAEVRQRNASALAYLAELERDTMQDQPDIPDKRLEMIFTCCHPALEEKTRVALTLRTLGGLRTEEIASAFLDRPDAMAQRLVRAKKKIRLAGIPYQTPEPEDLADRLNAVLKVIYLIFNEGYRASRGHVLTRSDLCIEAIRLCRILNSLMPGDCEVQGLLALMLLHDSRRYARVDAAGQMIALEDQNRARWDQGKIREGMAILERVLPQGRVGPYQLQAAISAVHAKAARWDDTDWRDIAGLYGVLLAIQPNPVARINHAVAVSYAADARAGLQVLDAVQEMNDMAQYQPYHAARAALLARDGQKDTARAAYERAIALTDNTAEIAFLQGKLAAL